MTGCELGWIPCRILRRCFEGTVDDERRLFYVATIRSQKLLHLTRAAVPGNRLYQAKSDFWEFVLRYAAVKGRLPNCSRGPPTDPKPRASVERGDEVLAYGKTLHDALAEVHARAMWGDMSHVLFGFTACRASSARHARWVERLFASTSPLRLREQTHVALIPCHHGILGPQGKPRSVPFLEAELIALALEHYSEYVLNSETDPY